MRYLDSAKRGSRSTEDSDAECEPPVFSHTLTKSDLIRYAGAAGDFHPLHTDDAGAQAAGFPGVFAHGMLSAGLLATAVTNWVGIGNLVRYRVRFVAQAWPDTTYHSRISIADRRMELGQKLIDFECSLCDERGKAIVRGTGTALDAGFVANPTVLGTEACTGPEDMRGVTS